MLPSSPLRTSIQRSDSKVNFRTFEAIFVDEGMIHRLYQPNTSKKGGVEGLTEGKCIVG